MNNLFQQLNQQQQINLPSSQNNNLLKQLLSSSNPNEFLNSMISNNPQMQNLLKQMQSSGMSPKQFFYNYANQQGINPDQFLNNLLQK